MKSNTIKTIEVTERHIAEGKTFSFAECPVALAVQEAYNADRAHVSSSDISIYSVGVNKYYSYCFGVAPLKVAEWIYAFDTHEDVEPFSFELDGNNPNAYWFVCDEYP